MPAAGESSDERCIFHAGCGTAGPFKVVVPVTAPAARR